MDATRVLRRIMPALLLTLVFAAGPATTRAQIAITVNFAPPALPVYEQPPCPEEGWMWAPGYWAYDEDGYYWVPGEWVPAPYVGAMWTPPWWGWEDGRYLFHEGYWGDDVGYYGGIDYGYGYMGEGFVGGQWRDGRFAYNTAVMRVNPTVVRNVYVDQTIVRERTVPNERHIAYNGGPGGIRHDPTPIERRGMGGRHTALTPVQQQQIQAARSDRSSYAKANGGRPQRVVVARPESGVRGGGAPVEPRPGRVESRPEPSRTSPAYRNEPNRNEPVQRPESRPEMRTAPTERRPYHESRPEPAPRPESRQIPEPRPESRPEPRPAPPSERPRPESRPAPQMERPGTESRPNPPAERPRPESRPEPQPRMESRPAPPAHESRPAPAPRESRPAEPHGSVSRPAQHEARPAESRPAAAHSEAHAGGAEKQGRPKSE